MGGSGEDVGCVIVEIFDFLVGDFLVSSYVVGLFVVV